MELVTWIEEQLDVFDVPGVFVAVVHGDEVVFQQGLGFRDLEAGLPVGDHTSFPIASVTKAFTATVVATLVDEGLLEWDRPLRHDIPGFQMHDPVATERTTPRDLLCHRTGLPRHDMVWYHAPEIARAEIVRRLRYLEPSADFRSAWQYNNLGYLAAGHLCEVVSGERWEDLVAARLFAPLGMSSSAFDVSQSKEPATVYAQRQDRLEAVKPYTDVNVGPAGSIHSTGRDMTRWLQFVLGPGEADGVEVLRAETASQLMKPHSIVAVPSMWPEVTNSAYGLGWFVGTYRGRRHVHHSGNIDGATSLISTLPDEGIGVVLLSNRGGTALRVAVAHHVFDTLLGVAPSDWSTRIHDLEVTVAAGARAGKAAVAKVAGTKPSHPLADYAGTYSHPAYGTLDISADDPGGRLVPTWRGLEATLEHRHYDVFDFEVPELENSHLAVRFSTDAMGFIEGFSIPFEQQAPPAVFVRQPDPIPETLIGTVPGTYSMGGLTMTVAVRGDGVDRSFLATGRGLPKLSLRPYRGLVLRLEGVQDGTARVGVDGERVTEIVMPYGVFVRTKEFSDEPG